MPRLFSHAKALGLSPTRKGHGGGHYLKIALIAFLAGFALSVSITSWGLSLDEQEVKIRWATWRYRVDEALMRAQLRLENGRKGSEAGMNPITPQSVYSGDVQAYSDPTMPDGAEQHARLARRIVWSMQKWVLGDPKRRAEWMEAYAEGYLKGGTKATGRGEKRLANYEYFRLLQKLYNEERDKIAGRRQGGGFNPVLEASQ